MQRGFFKNNRYSMNQVKENNTVKVHYTGRLSDGRVFDSSEGKDPLEFTLGKGQMIPGFEKGVIDMKLNQKKTITISEEEGYGSVNDDLRQEVKKSELPEDLTPEVGMGLVAKSANGQETNLRVVKVEEDSIIIDGNHPLAGKDLIFDLEVVAIKNPEIIN
jgi:FKBP-type peptidyl-prolyl cis-trans isomerase SlpA